MKYILALKLWSNSCVWTHTFKWMKVKYLTIKRGATSLWEMVTTATGESKTKTDWGRPAEDVEGEQLSDRKIKLVFFFL